MIAKDLFRNAMARFPSGVTIVTTRDQSGRPRGFTASSFCSVSADPPLVLVCLADTAECHDAFRDAAQWNIHILDARHSDLAMRFARRGADKFSGLDFEDDARGLPGLKNASVSLKCSRYDVTPYGDHSLLIGQVEHVEMTGTDPVYYYDRGFHPARTIPAPVA
ncbi:flavin reductase family protein [Celeribacter naphthalenivorans]|uniref:flavin reductase family protein n=1 Tax=Celeribacter naphthalenivorans TaxID=1614694 RepID=UPI001CFA59C4|nr:flavin reductase family protein [Celeribacter naphthalenivorans]